MAAKSNVHGAELILHIIKNKYQGFPFTVPTHICQEGQKNAIVDFARNCRSRVISNNINHLMFFLVSLFLEAFRRDSLLRRSQHESVSRGG